MGKTMIIVESPSKIKTIQKFLGNSYTIMASKGHLRDLPKSSLGVDIKNDFKPKYVVPKEHSATKAELIKASKSAGRILLATDPDREGEAIAWHLAQILNLDPKDKCRITFNEITATAVEAAIKKPRSVDMDLVNAQQARRIEDRLVGYQISPLLSRKLRQPRLSAGRVQSAALKMIADREREIADFVPEEYWQVYAHLTGSEGRKLKTKFYGENGSSLRLKNEQETNALLTRIQGKPYAVTRVQKDKKSSKAPAPFTTSTLQQESSRKLGRSAAQTMNTAQRLYEGKELGDQGQVGLITYMRTDSVRIAEEAITAVRAHIAEKFGEEYLPEKPNTFEKKGAVQDAHEAIRPTDLKNTPESVRPFLENDEYRLYKLIYERFVACQMAPRRYERTAVSFLCEGAEFRADGERPLFDGFTRVYTEGKDTETEKTDVLPELREGDVFTASKVDSEQCFTKPKPRFTEATLVKTMEENGIGRPSTYAATIKTLTDRKYVTRSQKVLTPTELGMKVADWMDVNFPKIVNAEYTAGMEKDLDVVAAGKKEWIGALQEFYGPFEVTLNSARETEAAEHPAPEPTEIPCKKCGKMLEKRTGPFGEYLCCGDENCKFTMPVYEELPNPVACPKCGDQIFRYQSKKGNPYYKCYGAFVPEGKEKCDFFCFNMPYGELCPQCGNLLGEKRTYGTLYAVCNTRGCTYKRKLSDGKKS